MADEVVLVRIEAVRVVGRHRRDLGDVKGLAASIADVGQLQPVVLAPGNRLVAGARRLAALRSLGKETALAVYRDDLDEVARALRAERDENRCRKDMAPSEYASLGSALEELERPKAAARRAASQAKPGDGQVGKRDVPGEYPGNLTGTSSGKTEEAVAAAIGVSTTTYNRIRQVHKAAADPASTDRERQRAKETLNVMDATGTVKPAYEEWKAGGTPTKPVEKRGPQRRPLPEAFDRAAADLVRAAEKLGRLVNDDRFPRNAEQAGRMTRHDLLHAADLLAMVIGRIPVPNKEATQ